MKTLDEFLSHSKKTGKPQKKQEESAKDSFGDDFIEAIDKFLASKIEESSGRKKKTAFSPSDTNLCARYWHYMFNGVDGVEPHDPRIQRVFDNGHAVHDRLYKYFKEMGILVDEELQVNLTLETEHGDVPFRTFVDCTLQVPESWDKDDLEIIVGELKSIGDAGFFHVNMKKKAKDDHYRQIQIYMHILQLEKGVVIYENKDNQQLAIITVEYDKEFMDKLLKKYAKIYKAYKEGVLPKRPYKSPQSKNCKYCKVRDMCWDDEREGDALVR